MKKSILILALSITGSLGCSAKDSKNQEELHQRGTTEQRMHELIQSLSSLEWSIPSYMSYGKTCHEFINDLTNNPNQITIVSPAVETDDWDSVQLQKYVGNCDKEEFTVNEQRRSVKTGGGDSSIIPSGKYFYAKNEYAIWDDPNSRSIILYTGPKYKLPDEKIGYVSNGSRKDLKKVFTYSGTFYELEANSCNKLESVNESASPLVDKDDPERKSGVIDYKEKRYLFLIANIGSEYTHLIRLFELRDMSIGKSICSAQHIDKRMNL